jgi:hypothetical protein
MDILVQTAYSNNFIHCDFCFIIFCEETGYPITAKGSHSIWKAFLLLQLPDRIQSQSPLLARCFALFRIVDMKVRVTQIKITANRQCHHCQVLSLRHCQVAVRDTYLCKEQEAGMWIRQLRNGQRSFTSVNKTSSEVTGNALVTCPKNIQ